ncbi:MAG: PorP/SprF family type IX secretion system membrane protein [Ferruginibacter sp.]|nr:PorP/SprF family type IX secretion system membrane protein [Ferruginibacter sp.]
MCFLKKYFIALILFSSCISAHGQDIHFSQIFETPVLRNPALAGIFSGDIRIQTVYRSQWNSITNAYQTGSSNIEYKIPFTQSGDFLTIAGQFLYDKAGTADLRSTHILPALNYHKSLNDEKSTYLSLAFMGGWVQRSIDRSKITTNSQYNGNNYDPTLLNGENFPKSSFSFFDANVGLSFNTQLGEKEDNNMFLGVAYHHFTKPKKISFYNDSKLALTPKWVASGGVRMSLDDYSFLTIEADYSKQGISSEIIGGMMYTKKLDEPEAPKYLLHGGAYFRFRDAIIPVLKIEAKPLAIAVSYDVNISGLKQASKGRGGFEVSLTYQKYLNKYNSSINSTKCPRF